MNTLLERLVSWAQNEEMINQYYTDHGKDCNEAVKEIERLTAALVEIRDYPEGEDGRLDSMEAIAREALQEESDDE